MSVRELSKKTGISASHILRIESGEFDFTLTKFLIIAEVLCLPVASIIEPILFSTRNAKSFNRNALEEKEFRLIVGENIEREQNTLNLLGVFIRTLIAVQATSNPRALVESIEFPFKDAKMRLAEYAERFDLNSSNIDRLTTISALVSRPFGQLRALGLIDSGLIESYFDWAKQNSFDFLDLKIDTAFNATVLPQQGDRAETVTEREPLTSISLKSKEWGVKSEVKKLIERVKRKASARGAKLQLARALGVAPARISEWLSGEKEPGGEYTLKLLHWVEQQERQK